ncbi:hypothetical protein GGQ61_003536 [Phenylobacterium haematophilum]|jgi:hypothetical protein|uniref:Uncharacterized protein n=1 Tax=Phenylobacterium haematophilum TaxID=98513 RepID=A0A840A336_9CAUL|nr:hypothetical protein [Phenylobacterium haematophilum]
MSARSAFMTLNPGQPGAERVSPRHGVRVTTPSESSDQ